MNEYRNCCGIRALPRIDLARRVFAVIAAVAALTVSVAHAEPLRIVTIALTPYGMTDADNRDIGIGYEIGNLIAEESGLKYENQVVPYARSVAMIEAGSADFLLALPNERLKNIAVQVAPVLQLEIVVVGRADSKFKQLSDLRGRTVAVVNGAHYDAAFDGDGEIVKYSTTGNEHSVRMLLAGHVDAVIAPRASLVATFKRLGVEPTAYGQPLVLSKVNSYLNFSKKNFDPKTAGRLSAAVARLVQRNAFQPIVDKYFEAQK